MPRQTKPSGGQLPRSADDKTVEGIAHDHGDGDKNHIHRLGNVPHDHDAEGGAIIWRPAPGDLNVAEPAEGFGHDQFGTDPDTGTYHPAPDPDGDLAKAVARDQHQEQTAERRRAEIAAAVTDTDRAEMELIGATHPHILRDPDGAGARNGEARPMPGGSVGHIVAGTALESLYGTPDDVADEKTHGGLAAQLLFEIAEADWAVNRPADAAKLVQLHGLIHHMLGARGLLPTPAEVEAAGGGT